MINIFVFRLAYFQSFEVVGLSQQLKENNDDNINKKCLVQKNIHDVKTHLYAYFSSIMQKP